MSSVLKHIYLAILQVLLFVVLVLSFKNIKQDYKIKFQQEQITTYSNATYGLVLEKMMRDFEGGQQSLPNTGHGLQKSL